MWQAAVNIVKEELSEVFEIYFKRKKIAFLHSANDNWPGTSPVVHLKEICAIAISRNFPLWEIVIGYEIYSDPSQCRKITDDIYGLLGSYQPRNELVVIMRGFSLRIDTCPKQPVHKAIYSVIAQSKLA